jgi:predicted Fe-Mo cluster-binding NifX family protein
MKIAVPVIENNGMMSEISKHFGSAPFFAFYDTENAALEIIDNAQKRHEPGSFNPAKAFEEKNIDAVFVSGIGMGAIQVLKSMGIKVYSTDYKNIKELVNSMDTTELKEVDASDCCKQHNCH